MEQDSTFDSKNDMAWQKPKLDVKNNMEEWNNNNGEVGAPIEGTAYSYILNTLRFIHYK